MKSAIIFIFFLSNSILLAQSFERKNLGKNVNSQYDELSPTLSPDGKTLYFCRGGDPQNKGVDQVPDDQDIWASYLQKNGRWSKAIHLDGAFNSTTYDSPIGTSADGSTLYVRNMYSRDGSTTSSGISRSRKSRGQWSFPHAMAINDYYNTSTIVNYHLASDEKTLILNLRRNDTAGQMDLYVSFLQEDGKWSAPLNMGNDINSSFNEVTPFIAADMKSLYFSSERSGGLGGYDLYISKRIDDTWQRWTPPKNLGPKINSERHEISYFVAASGDHAIFSVSTPNRGKDLYTVNLPKKYRPEKVVLVSGLVKSQSGKPQEATIIYERIGDGKTLGQTTSDPITGAFKVSIPAGKRYGFRAEKKDYLPVVENLDLSKVKKTTANLSLTLMPIRKGTTIRFKNIFFLPRSAKLTATSFPELKRLGKFLKNNTKIKIQIEGHTDSIGSLQYNKNLSNQRANAVKAYLVSVGAKKTQLDSKGYGETKPVASNKSTAGRKKNRRVEFRIIEN